MLTIGATVATYISMYYLGTYAVKYPMAQAYGYAAMLLAGLVTFGGSLLVGHWCDRYGRLPLIRGSRIAILIVALPAFWWLSAVPHPAVLLLIVAVLVGLTTLGSVPTMLMISELFPQRIRALGFALVYSPGGDFRRLRSVHRFAVDRAERFAAGARRLSDAGDAGFAGGAAAAA